MNSDMVDSGYMNEPRSMRSTNSVSVDLNCPTLRIVTTSLSTNVIIIVIVPRPPIR